VPGQYSTIQSAINACVAYDTVLVDSGTYVENIVWTNVIGIKLLSTAGAANTIIDGNASGTTLDISPTNSDSFIVVSGFTITNGNVVGDGGGIFIDRASPLLENLVVKENHASNPNWAYGAGIYSSGGNLTMINVEVTNNTIDTGSWCFGAGLYFENGILKISDCNISANNTHCDSWCYGIGVYLADCSVDMNRTTISGNKAFDNATWYYGAGFYAEETEGTLTNVLVYNNYFPPTGSFHYGAGIYLRSYATIPPILSITNCTIANNISSGTIANGFYNDGDSVSITSSIVWSNQTGTEVSSSTASQLKVSYSDIRGGYSGTGNINVDPEFVSASDFHLLLSSPCIAVATLTGSPVDDVEGSPRPMPSGNNPDMGAYEMDESVDGFSSMENVDELTVYPNPFSGKLFLSSTFSCSGKTIIKVITGSGEIIFSKQSSTQSQEIDLSNIPCGIYFLQLVTDEKVLVRKIVKL
jgi:hypothetical protein